MSAFRSTRMIRCQRRVLFLASCCALALLTGCSGGGAAATSPPLAEAPGTNQGLVVFAEDSPKLAQVQVAAVGIAEIPIEEVNALGRIEVNPNLVSHLLLPVPGRIVTLPVRLGDAVSQGQVLLTLESPEADSSASAYQQAEAGLMQARAGLVKAQSDFDRAADLFQHDAIAKKEVIGAENSLAQAKGILEQALAAREQAVRRLEILGLKPGAFGQKIAVRAPMNGKILDINAAAGEYRNDTSTSLMTIADLSSVWVSSDVPESAIRLVKPGERLDVTLTAYPDKIFRARVTRIADRVDPQTRTVRVRAELDNRNGHLLPEMFASVHHVESTRSLPVVPTRSVVRDGGQTLVWVEESRGRFRQRPIQTGKRLGDLLAVLRGVQPGERIVTEGALLLR